MGDSKQTPTGRPPQIPEYSAGGVVFRPLGDTYEIAVVHRNRHTDWSLPKGHIEKGETREQAALREVKEETGLDARIVAPIGEVVYFYRRTKGLTRKVVYHFLLKYTGGEFGPPNWEVDKARWVPINEADNILTYENDRQVVGTAREMLEGKG